MADVWKAYKFINHSLGLKLSDDRLFEAERAFKREFMKELGYGAQHTENVDEWEFFGHLTPTKVKKFPPTPSSTRESV